MNAEKEFVRQESFWQLAQSELVSENADAAEAALERIVEVRGPRSEAASDLLERLRAR